jgi:hypothetical protein
VDVDGLTRQCARVTEGFHAINQRADAIGFLADELRELFLLIGNHVFEKLGRAANAGERVLDFVGEHCRHPVERPDGPSMKELAIQPMGKAPLLERHEYRPFWPRQRRHSDVREALAMTGRCEVHVALAQRAAALARLGRDLDERTAEGEHVMESLPDQETRTHIEELFGRRIYE